MWDLPRLDIEPVFPVLACGFFTTEPPGKYNRPVLSFDFVQVHPNNYASMKSHFPLNIVLHNLSPERYIAIFPWIRKNDCNIFPSFFFFHLICKICFVTQYTKVVVTLAY